MIFVQFQTLMPLVYSFLKEGSRDKIFAFLIIPSLIKNTGNISDSLVKIGVGYNPFSDVLHAPSLTLGTQRGFEVRF